MVIIGWVSWNFGAKNGKVIKIISHSNGLANISIDPSGVIATQAELDALGITVAEQTELALTYTAGKELWRVQVSHLTPWDCNWGIAPPEDAEESEADEPKTEDEEEPKDPCDKEGCIIEAENQVLGETIPIVGSAFSLNYRSSRSLGNKTNMSLSIPISGDTLPPSLKAIELSIRVAGQSFQQRYPATTNQTITWEWNGLDAYGREVNSSYIATIQIDYIYNVVYKSASPDFEASFATFGYSDSRIIAERSSSEIKLSKKHFKKLGSFVATQAGLGLWSLSRHHIYDPNNQTLYLGDGSQHRADTFGNRVITTVAGNGNWGFSGDGGLATNAMIHNPEGITADPKGNLYIADANNNRIRKVDSYGVITTIAGNGQAGFSGDGGSALDATINAPEAIAVGPDGTLYIVDDANNRIRKIDNNGIITTVAGTGIKSYSGDGGLAVNATLSSPEGIVVGSEGELYIADSGNHRIRKIGTDGIITTIAGIGQWSYSGDDGPAVNAGLAYPRRIAIGLQGELYIADIYNNRIRKVTTDGIITTVAGNGLKGFSGDGGRAIDAMLAYPGGVTVGSEGELYITDIANARIRMVGTNGIITTIVGKGQGSTSGDTGLAADATMNYPLSIAADPEGALYIADYFDHRIRRIASAWEEFSIADFSIASEDGQKLFHFDASGRHIRTLDTVTGGSLYTFAYTTSGLLDSVTDRDGDITQIQRAVNGIPLAIIAPDGQITTFGLNANGYLSNVTDPLGQSHIMAYDANGLMMSYSNPNLANSSYQYDTLGRLVQDVNSENGGWELSRSDFSNGYNVTMNSAENRSTLYRVETLSTGNYQRQITAPNGTITTQLTKTNGEEVTSHPNGTLVSTKKGPDPRFGMMAPVITNSTIQTPAGLLSTSSQINTATLIDNNDPLAVSTLTESSTINGRTLTSQYDANTKTWTDTSAANRISSIQINSKGRPVLSQVSGLEASNYIYDSRGRVNVISKGSGSDMRSYQFDYYQDGTMNGYLQSITNAENQVTRFEYDAVGRLTKQILSDNREISYSYDANGNIVSLTPPGRTAHIFNYDGLDQSTQYTPPAVDGINNPRTTYSYNRDKQLTKITRPDGQQVNLNYGINSGKLENISIPSGTINYAYDSGTGQLTSIATPGNGILNFSYDGFLHTQAQWSGEISGIVEQSYDNDFRVTNRNINGSNSIAFQYDSDSLLTQVGSLNISRETSKGGLINGTTLGNFTTSRTYSGFAELTSYNAAYNGTNLYSTSYSRDKLGRITQKVETINGENTTTDYEYDLAGRLTSEKNDNSTITYTYDSNGNRTHINGILVGNYDEQDRLISYAQSDYQYSANGELQVKIEAGQTTLYNYDVLGNLTRVSLNDGTIIDYVIDGRNRRIGKKVNGILLQGFLYKDQLNPIVELDGNNQIIGRFVYGSKGNVPDYMIKNGNTYQIISDNLGSPRLVVDTDTGDIVQRIDYDTWGNVIYDTNPGLQPFGFAGGLYDQHTQLTRFGARDYEAWTGRWTTKDPIRFDGGDTNLFGYVLNNPVNFSDPTGLYFWPGYSPIGDYIQATADFWNNYWDMKDANVIGSSDKYFHCKANCQASRQGAGGESAAEVLSELRELTDEYIKMDTPQMCNADRAANKTGRDGRFDKRSCRDVCNKYRPNGMPNRY